MKASITTSFARAYKYGNETAQTPEEVFDNIIYPYNLGEFEKVIDLSRFDVTYYANDTNQEHPVYILKDEYKTQKINLNGESVSTLYTNDHKSIDYTTREEYTDKVIGCGFGIPSGQTVPSNHTAPTDAKTDEQDVEPADRYNQVYYNQTRYTYRRNDSGMVPRMQYVYDNLFENGIIDGITPIYLSDDDSMIVPAVDTVKRKVCYYNKLGNKTYMREPTATPYFLLGALTYGGANNRYDGWSGMFELLQEIQPDPEEDTYLTFYPPVPYSGTGISANMGYGTRTGSGVLNTKTIPIFLRDKNGEYWFWNITGLPNYLDYGYPRPGYFTQHSEYVVKVKDLPAAWISNGVISATNGSWITDEQFADIGQVDRYLDTVFNPEIGSDYNDNGPDIIGAGEDPYDGIDNIDGVVGGRPNMDIDIETDEGSYNNSGQLFRNLSSMYGAYAFSSPNGLYQYTRTLKLIYDDWKDPFYDPLIKSFADRLLNNTINILRLPYNISLVTDGDANPETVASTFIIGNVGVANNIATFNDWAWGRNLATADLIVKEIHTYELNLGTISRFYDNFLDFAPYSSASLYIPYIGSVDLPINLVQSTSDEEKQLKLLFRINNTTGDMVVLLQVNGATYKQWTGNCAAPIQIHTDDMSGVMRSAFKQTVNGITTVATGLMGAVGTIASSVPASNQKPRIQAMSATDVWHKMKPVLKSGFTDNLEGGIQGAKGKLDFMNNTVDEVLSSTGTPVSSHNVGSSPTAGEIGYMGPQEVILTVERPIMWRPDRYGETVGYPTKKIAKLGSIKGFARITNIHLRCTATAAEMSELEQLLSTGVMF